jgi:hypothetical protein
MAVQVSQVYLCHNYPSCCSARDIGLIEEVGQELLNTTRCVRVIIASLIPDGKERTPNLCGRSSGCGAMLAKFEEVETERQCACVIRPPFRQLESVKLFYMSYLIKSHRVPKAT